MDSTQTDITEGGIIQRKATSTSIDSDGDDVKVKDSTISTTTATNQGNQVKDVEKLEETKKTQ